MRALAKEYYKATKGCRALIWSRGLRDMAGLGQELTDEELAAQDFANGDAYRLTILGYGAHVQRREWLMPLMFALMDATHGNLPVLMDFLEWHRVPFKVFDRSDCGDTPPKKKNGGGLRQH